MSTYTAAWIDLGSLQPSDALNPASAQINLAWNGQRPRDCRIHYKRSLQDSASAYQVFRWTKGVDMEALNDVYANLLAPIGSFLHMARAISPNGCYIVGQGFNAATDRYKADHTHKRPGTCAETLERLPAPQSLLPEHHASLPTHSRATCTSEIFNL